MQYGRGDCLNEYGFQFYENLHNPIFLVNKNGRVLKINEYGRKLLTVANINMKQIEELLMVYLDKFTKSGIIRRAVLKTKNQSLHFTMSSLSEYFLIEVRR